MLLVANNVHAVGMVVDAPILETMTALNSSLRAEEAVQAFEQAVKLYEQGNEQFSQLQQLEAIANGTSPFSDLLNNGLLLENMPADMADAMNNVVTSYEYREERNKLPNTSNPKLAVVYEQYAMSKALQRRFYRKVAMRQTRIENLKKRVESTTPQDVKDRETNLILLQKEQLEMNSDAQVMTSLKEAQDAQRKQAVSDFTKNRLCQQLSATESASERCK
jgi:hypothetical protein